MNQFIPALAVMLLIALPAQADVFKCKNAQGKIEYSDVPCQGAVATHIQNNTAAEPPSSSNERALSMYFNQAMAERDYDRAARLANTPQQAQMVIDAQNAAQQMRADKKEAERRAAEDAQRTKAAAAAARRPTVCSTTSFNNGGISTGTAVCR